MDEYFEELLRAIDTGLHSLAVSGALAVPDMLGALGPPNGLASGSRHRAWWKENSPGTQPTCQGTAHTHSETRCCTKAVPSTPHDLATASS